jgi:aminopeptidase N
MTGIELDAVLYAKLGRMFPDEAERAQAREALWLYGTESWERERERVRLAILKLAGASLEQIRCYCALAKVDVRDVLAWAEYPSWMARQARVGLERIAAAERRRYQAWLRQ